MKISSIFRLIASAFVSAACLVSCGGSGSGGDEEPTSTFDVKNRLVSVTSEGGNISVDYGIKGPKEGNTAELSTDADWIHLGKVYSTTFSFTADKNDSDSDRTGEIKMTCTGVQPLTLVVSQGKKGSASPTYNKFKIEVSEITTSSARVVITPVDAAETYLYSIVSKADYDKCSDDVDYIKKRIDQIKELSAMSGAKPAAFLNSGNFDTSKQTSSNQQTVYDNTIFYAVAFDLAFDDKGTPSYSGKLDKVEFRTKKATPVNMTFTLNMSGTYLNVTPSLSSETWICDVTTKESWDELPTPEDVAHTYVNTMLQYSAWTGGLTIYKGNQSVNVESSLDEKGKEYVAYAVGYRQSDTDGGLTTEVKHITFKY